MDSETFEEVMVESAKIEDQKKWILEGMECKLIYFKGEVIEVQVPSPFIYTITETECFTFTSCSSLNRCKW